jgi:hypothetical protein
VPTIDDIKLRLEDMTDEELESRLLEIRKERRTPVKPKRAAAKKKKKTGLDIEKLTDEQKLALLQMLEGKA